MTDAVVRPFTRGDLPSAVACGRVATGNSRAWWERVLAGPLAARADVRVAELDGRVVAFALGHPLQLRLRGATLAGVGIGSVTTHPAYRRRGLAGAVVHELVDAARKRGVPLGLLRPLSHEVYRGGGWELADETIAYRLDPRAVPCDAAAHRRVRPAAADDADALARLYDDALTSHALALARSGERWRELLASRDCELAVSVGERGVEGYVLYRLLRPAQDDDDHDEVEAYKAGSRQWEVAVCELVSRTPQAWRGLWSLLGSYDHRQWVLCYAAPRDQPLHPFLPHAYVDARVEPGYMLRVLDAAAVLEAIGAAAAPDDEAIELLLDDPRLPQQDPARLAGGAGQLALGVGRFAQLLAGYCSLDDLVARGLIEAPSSAVRRAVARALPTGSSWIPPVDAF